MTLERILKMHKVLAQLSPAASTDNISAATSAIRSALASGQMQNWASTVSQHASGSVSLSEGLTWWASMDKALTAEVVVSLLHVAEGLLDGGRIWALLGQPQPMFELLLVTDQRHVLRRAGGASAAAVAVVPASVQLQHPPMTAEMMIQLQGSMLAWRAA
jgi:hypothetical protein